MKTAHHQRCWEVGFSGNARPYPHDSLFCVKYQVLAAKAELLKGGLHAGMLYSSAHPPQDPSVASSLPGSSSQTERRQHLCLSITLTSQQKKLQPILLMERYRQFHTESESMKRRYRGQSALGHECLRVYDLESPSGVSQSQWNRDVYPLKSMYRFAVKTGRSFAVDAGNIIREASASVVSTLKYLISRSSTWSTISLTVLYIPNGKGRACRVSS